MVLAEVVSFLQVAHANLSCCDNNTHILDQMGSWQVAAHLVAVLSLCINSLLKLLQGNREACAVVDPESTADQEGVSTRDFILLP